MQTFTPNPLYKWFARNKVISVALIEIQGQVKIIMYKRLLREVGRKLTNKRHYNNIIEVICETSFYHLSNMFIWKYSYRKFYICGTNKFNSQLSFQNICH